jgi:plasmid stability protein
MAQLLVRNLEENVKRRLRARAKSHGRSMEEEARVIIRDAVSVKPGPQEGLGTRLAKHFAGKVPKEFKIVEMRGGTFRIPEFDDE